MTKPQAIRVISVHKSGWCYIRHLDLWCCYLALKTGYEREKLFRMKSRFLPRRSVWARDSQPQRCHFRPNRVWVWGLLSALQGAKQRPSLHPLGARSEVTRLKTVCRACQMSPGDGVCLQAEDNGWEPCNVPLWSLFSAVSDFFFFKKRVCYTEA